jgi:hypothetical protein
MRFNYLKVSLKKAVFVTTVLLLGAGLALAQTVNLTAAPAPLTLPDGTTVNMWGYSCTTSGLPTVPATTCASLNTHAALGTWSPVVITVPTGKDLHIHLVNNLTFMNGNSVPTSLVIVGQVGGGLGTAGATCTDASGVSHGATCTTSPDHSNAQQLTWPSADPGTTNPVPAQGPRVQSFATEVAGGAAADLTWTAPRAGTYLIESGTHPSIQGPMGLYGILVVTDATTGTAYGTAGTATAVSYNADVPLLLSEIDPVQNNEVSTVVNTAGFSETMVWSGQAPNPTNPAVPAGGGCGYPGSPTYHQCYPPAVNYTPTYYLVNGVAFDKTHGTNSLFAVNPATPAVGGKLLARVVNAGLRMHVPSIVGAQTGAAVAPATQPPAGFSLIAEDGNPLPGTPRVQSEVFMAAGKTYDVMLNVPAGTSALPIFDRELSLSGNGIGRDEGMLAYINGNGLSGLPAAAVAAAAAANDTYNSVIAGQTLTVSDVTKGLLGNDTNVYGVRVVTPAGCTNGVACPLGKGTVTLNADGTFTYAANGSWTASDGFTYCGNGATSGSACATVTFGAAPMEAASGITCSVPAPPTYTSTISTALSIHPPGVLSFCKDAAGYPLTVASTSGAASGLTVAVDSNGGFNASVSASGTYTFDFVPKNSQGTIGGMQTVTLNFPTGNGPTVTVLDGKDKLTKIDDYRWVIEEDRTFYVDPACTTNPPAAGCPVYGTAGIVPTFGANFHTSYMPLVAAGCTGPRACESGQTLGGVNVACDIGNGICTTDRTQQAMHFPTEAVLDPTKRYYITIFPGDASNSFVNGGGAAVDNGGNGRVFDPSQDCTNEADTGNPCGHGMGGAPIAKGQNSVTVLVQPNPFPPSKLSVFVFEDDFPLNGEQDGGGGTGLVVSPDEPGLGGFNIILFDDAGGTGDATGQMTYDMFNQPLGNSLAGTVDPATGNDACPISVNQFNGVNTVTGNYDTSAGKTATSTLGITGTIVTCPKYEADGTTLSPLAGQAVVANLMPGRYGVVATPGADRIARGEEWLQTNTLDGQKAHDSFLRIGEPAFFQEFGPAGYHVSIGFANPKIIQDRLANVCNGSDPNISGSNCTNSISGTVTTERMSRTPDERLYSSGDNSSFSFTQCYVSFGDADGEDFAFTKCLPDGTFSIGGLPDGDWRVTVFDQWNDMLVDGLSTPVRLDHTKPNSGKMGDIAMNQWQANLYTATFFDSNYNGVQDDNEDGLALVATNIRFRDGSYSNFNNTDLHGQAGFNEVFPLFSWYVVETDTTRYKSTGVHVVYDAGGPADGSPSCGGAGNAPCGASGIGNMMANTQEQVSLPMDLRVPGARYCNSADCPTGDNGSNTGTDGAYTPGAVTVSTGRVDPPFWFGSEGWQGFSGQNSFIEFGKKPYSVGETGGIHGEVTYASTRPFDDPQLLLHTSWTPNVPGVTINLYQETTAPDGSTALHLVDTTVTSSWDAWAQGFRTDGKPNMNCPGQGKDTGAAADLFYFSLFNQPNYLDFYQSQHTGGSAVTQIPYNSEFKCYDGMHNWNQVQPAPYDGMYQFPSVTSFNPTTGKPAGTRCHMSSVAEPWGCVPNPTIATGPTTAANYDPYRAGLPMLPAGKYVVEMIVPPGYELVKEEDKNILIGDNYIAPVTQEFGGLGSVFILPDQAALGNTYNPNNAQNPTTDLGATPRHEGDTGSVETFWPCVGASRVVPDYLSLFPAAQQVAPFAGATRNLCDRKEVTLDDQTAALAKFWVFTSAHVAAHYTGVITDDFTSEFDPFSPQFGEKFSPPNMPISLKDWTGTEISRTYADEWGTYDGLTYSTWEVNPPNPTGYAPTMMVVCMNDPGTGNAPDALYNPQYSQFCYEIPFMPGQTQYMDTPVVPTSAFAGAGYNNPDCAYPAATPAIKEVDGDGIGPYVSASGHNLTITALGDVNVPNNAYSGPGANTSPYNQKTVVRHFGFGASAGTVTIGGLTANVVGPWTDGSLTVQVPNNVPLCAVQQQAQYGGSQARCGQLVITAANGQQSIDAVTVTVGGKQPTHVDASGSIQTAIDQAKPGDLLIVDPTCTGAAGIQKCSDAGVTSKTATTHQEMLLMWKPVRLQGVGAASSVINANTHPAGKMDTWRAQVNCLFGLGLDGSPKTWSSACAGANWFGFNATGPQVDRLPFEAVVGWDATLNGNLAELLQEPSLMGALEGAGITVLSKGLNFHGQDPYSGLDGGFPTGTSLLLGFSFGGNGNFATGDLNLNCVSGPNRTNRNPSNFQCNPSSIDGLSITDSSQGGGGIFVHAWGHNLQIANNRIYSNEGTLSGGINLGQGEFPPGYLGGSIANSDPGSCVNEPTNVQEPYCFNIHVNIHHNAITQNSSTGDELFSATPAGAGGVSMCNGADYYTFQYNWVCGNLSTGDGGGVAHIGFSYNGDIEHNSILFNQSTNPTIPTNGGGILAMGAPDVDPPCTSLDQDCLSAPNLISPSDGTGPNLVINANLVMGNSADSGSGGGLRLQNINGTEVVNFPTSNTATRWNHVSVTNNIIVNNVAGWDGGGISLLDALNTDIVNNTIMSNDSTASAGPLFNTIGAPLASSSGTNCIQGGANGTASCPQVGGLVSVQNSAVLKANFPNTINCPANHGTGGTNGSGLRNGACRYFSYPELWNNAFWQNRTFYIGVGALGGGTENQQNIVSLFNSFTGTAVGSQTGTGSCTFTANAGGGGGGVGSSYWDIGVRGDTGPANHTGSIFPGHAAGFPLSPVDSVITDIADYSGNGNSGNSPLPIAQYCNGSRIPPELLAIEGARAIWQVPAGISDATVPNPLFNLTPNATVDEGNNWINMSWGPLAEANPTSGLVLGNYGPLSGSSVINRVPGGTNQFTAAPALDFYGNARKTNNSVDAGAVEFQGANVLPQLNTISPNNGFRGDVYNVTLTGSNLAGGTINVPFGSGITVSNVVTSAGSITATFTIAPNASLNGGGVRNISVTTGAGTSNNVTFTVSDAPAVTLTSISPNTGARGSSFPVSLVGTNFTTNGTTIAISGNGIIPANFVTFTNVTVVDSSHINATINIPAGAAGGANSNRNVTVNTPAAGVSNAVVFTVHN